MEENRPFDVLDILLDDDNHDNITLYDDKENPVEFEQVAVIPLGDEENGELYGKYRELADKEAKIIFGGRLGEYKYYDMDAVVASALSMVKKELK